MSSLHFGSQYGPCWLPKQILVRTFWTTSSLLQKNFLISGDFLSTKFNAFNNPSTFLYMIELRSETA